MTSAPSSPTHALRAVSDRTEIAEPSPLLYPQPYSVVDKVTEIDLEGEADIVTLHVVPVNGELPTFRPAQCGMLGAFGVGEAAISISTSTSNRDYHGYTIRDAGPISGALVNTPIGGTITVRVPFGNPWPIEEVTTSQLLIVGGGLGIAPLRAVIEEALEPGRFERVVIVYGAKRPNLLVYPSDLARWADMGAQVELIVDEGDDSWKGPVGVVPKLLSPPEGVELNWADTTAFVCGPDIMMHYSALALAERGMPKEKIWLTLERNMQCGNALCGHCQLGPIIVCRDGPVVRYDEIAPFQPVEDL